MAANVVVKARSAWKKVEIDHNVFSQNDMEGFVCMEELTDYDFVKGSAHFGPSDVGKRVVSSPKKKKKGKSGAKAKSTLPTAESTHTEQSYEKKKRTDRKTVVNKSNVDLHDTENQKKTKLKDLKEHKKKVKEKARRKKKEGRMIGSGEVVDVGQEEMETWEKTSQKRKLEDKSETVPRKKQKASKKKKKQHTTDTLCQKEAAGEVGTKKEAPQRHENLDMSGWKNLFVPESVLMALEDQGFVAPTPIQALTLPSAIRDRMDVVGAAETGSGKTLAFGIPLIHHILEYKEKLTQEQLQNSSSRSADSSDEEEHDTADENLDNADDGSSSDLKLAEDERHDSENEDSDAKDVEGPNIVDLDTIDWSSIAKLDSEIGNDSDDCDLPPEEEEIEELGDEDLGCVKVITDLPVDWPQKPTKEERKGELLALILAPTRELAIQVKDHLKVAAKYTDIRIAAVVGGMAPQKQMRLLRACPEIVVATPGRLWELIQEGQPHLSSVTGIKYLVVDEADRMVEKGHFEELAKLLEMINEEEDKLAQRQSFVFSATLTMVHSGPQRLILKKKKKFKMTEKQKLESLMGQIGVKERPKIIDLTKKTGTAESLTEARINCPTDAKDYYLYYFLKQYPGRTLVFANSKDCLRRLASVLTCLNCTPLPLHADMHQRQRLKNLDRFKGNPNGLLLATDVAARGLDIPNVQHVIHYQVPRTSENYVHRSGRTARANKEGLSVVLVGPEDVKNYRKIIQTLNRDEELPVFPVEEEYFPGIKARVNLARQLDKAEHRTMKQKKQNSWFQRAAKDMDIELDEDEFLHDMGDSYEQAQQKQRIQQLRQQLKILLGQPLIHGKFSGKYPTMSGKLVVPHIKGKQMNAVGRVKKDIQKDKDAADKKGNNRRKKRRKFWKPKATKE